MAILRRFTAQVQPISIDEAFLDVTGSRALFGDGETIARSIRRPSARRWGSPRRWASRRRSWSPRSGPTCASPTGSSSCRRARRRRSSRRCRSRGCGAWARRPRAVLREFGVETIGDLAAPAARGARAAVRQARRGAGRAGARGSTRTRWRPASPRSRSGTSTRSGATRAEREVIERTLLGMADGVAWRLRAAGLKAGDGHAQAARLLVHDDHAARRRWTSRPT